MNLRPDWAGLGCACLKDIARDAQSLVLGDGASAPTDPIMNMPANDDDVGPVAAAEGGRVPKKKLTRNASSDQGMSSEVLAPWVEYTKTVYHNTCNIIVDRGSSEANVHGLKESALNIKWEESLAAVEQLWVFFDAKTMGHSLSHAQWRLCPFCDDLCNMGP